MNPNDLLNNIDNGLNSLIKQAQNAINEDIKTLTPNDRKRVLEFQKKLSTMSIEEIEAEKEKLEKDANRN